MAKQTKKAAPKKTAAKKAAPKKPRQVDQKADGHRSQRTKRVKQNLFLEHYRKTFGNISDSCKAASVTRNAYYQYWANDEYFQERLKEIDVYQDSEEFLRSKLYEHIDNNNITALIFALKCKGRWKENQEPPAKENNLHITIEHTD